MTLPRKNILVVTYWSYQDALIQTYTLPYVRIIQQQLAPDSKVFLFTASKTAGASAIETTADNIQLIQKPYHLFGMKAILENLRSIWRLYRLIKKEKIDTIHSWCTPAGSFAVILAMLSRRKLVIDSFEPHALPMVEGHTWSRKSLAFKLLFRFEKLQYKKADYVITAAPGMDQHAEKVYGVHRDDCFVKPACVNLQQFSISNRKKPELLRQMDLEDKIVCVYAGKFGGLYLEKETFDFFKRAQAILGERFRVLLLTNHSEEEIMSYCRQSEVDRRIIKKAFVPHRDIADYIGLADFGICPMKPLPSRRYGTPIKNGEYWALGLPVVITKNISIDSQIIEEHQAGYVLKELTMEEYDRALQQIKTMLEQKSWQELYNGIRPLAEKYRNFSIAEGIYKTIYQGK